MQQRNQACVKCDIFFGLLHVKCTNLTKCEYESLKSNDFKDVYFCQSCYPEIFPYHNALSVDFIPPPNKRKLANDTDHDSCDSPPTTSSQTAGADSLSDTNVNNSDVSPYHDVNSLKNLVINKSVREISIIHFNAISLEKNIDSIQNLLLKLSALPDIICISETKLQDDKINNQINFVQLPNYNFEFNNSKTKAGGTAMYIHESLDYKIRNDFVIKTYY